MNKQSKLDKDLLMEKFSSNPKFYQIESLPVSLKKEFKISSQQLREMRALLILYHAAL